MTKFTVWAVQLLHDEREIEAEDLRAAEKIAEGMAWQDNDEVGEEFGYLDPDSVIESDHGVGHETWTKRLHLDHNDLTIVREAAQDFLDNWIIDLEGEADDDEQHSVERLELAIKRISAVEVSDMNGGEEVQDGDH